jgi:uncharacterized protein (DUF302 family)
MKYYIEKTLEIPFDKAIERATEALKSEGFGVLTTIAINEKLKEKLGVEFRKYTILGACNPPLAYQALQAENKIGTMLPCNVIVQETDDGLTEVAAVDPVVSMQGVQNQSLAGLAMQVRDKLSLVIEGL